MKMSIFIAFFGSNDKEFSQSEDDLNFTYLHVGDISKLIHIGVEKS